MDFKIIFYYITWLPKAVPEMIAGDLIVAEDGGEYGELNVKKLSPCIDYGLGFFIK